MKSANQSVDVLRGIALLALVFEIWMLAVMLPTALQENRVDFSAYYSAGRSLWVDSSKLYDLEVRPPFIHPAYEAILFAPLSLLGYRSAFLVFALVNIALLVLVWRSLKLSWELLAFAPVSVTLLYGQDSILFLAVLCAAWLAARKHRPELCGLMLGLGMFRFQNILPMILLLLVWREWKVIRGFLISAAVTVALSELLVSPVRYYRLLASLSQHPAGSYMQPIERMVNLRGLSSTLAPDETRWLLPLCSLAVMIWCGMMGRQQTLSNRLALAVTACALVSFHFYTHDWIIMLIPLSIGLEASNRARWLAAFLIAASLLTVFNSRFYLIPLATVVLMIDVSMRTKKLIPAPMVPVCMADFESS